MLTALKQPPPLLIDLTPHQRLDLAPISALPGAIGSITTLAHHAFQPMALGHLEQRLAVTGLAYLTVGQVPCLYLVDAFDQSEQIKTDTDAAPGMPLPPGHFIVY